MRYSREVVIRVADKTGPEGAQYGEVVEDVPALARPLSVVGGVGLLTDEQDELVTGDGHGS